MNPKSMEKMDVAGKFLLRGFRRCFVRLVKKNPLTKRKNKEKSWKADLLK
jgi:hypothetical protein